MLLFLIRLINYSTYTSGPTFYMYVMHLYTYLNYLLLFFGKNVQNTNITNRMLFEKYRSDFYRMQQRQTPTKYSTHTNIVYIATGTEASCAKPAKW